MKKEEKEEEEGELNLDWGEEGAAAAGGRELSSTGPDNAMPKTVTGMDVVV